MSRVLKIKHFLFSQKQRLYLILPVFISLLIFISNAFYTSYPDEFDNLLGGKYILQGLIPYKDFFSHHGPGGYYLAALVQLFSGTSFVRFRVIYEILLFVIVWLGFVWLKKRYHAHANYYIVTLLLLAISASYFWTHMLLADSLAGWLFLPLYSFIALNFYYKQKITLIDLGIISFLAFAIFITSYTYSYLILLVYLFTGIKFLYQNKHEIWVNTGRFMVIMLVPYLMLLLLLFVSRSVSDYFYQTFTYNTNFYIYNYDILPGKAINPLRYAISIAVAFQDKFAQLLISIRNFNLNYPINPLLAAVNISFIILSLFEKQYLLAIFIWVSMIFSTVRSNPYDSKETDYQMAVYLMFSVSNAVFVLKELYVQLSHTGHSGKKIIYQSLLVICGLYAIFGVIFFVQFIYV